METTPLNVELPVRVHVLTALTAVVLAFICYRGSRWWASYCILARLPQPKAKIPLVGNIEFSDVNHHHRLLEWSKELGGIYFLRILWMKFVIVTDVHLAHEVLRAGLDKASIYKVIQRFNRGGHPTMFTASTRDPYWHLVRKAMAPAFSTKNIKLAFEKLLPLCEQFAGILYRMGPFKDIDMCEAAQRLTIDEISILAFDLEVGTLKGLVNGQDISWLHDVKEGLEELHKQAQGNPFRPYMIFLPAVVKGHFAIWRCQKETMGLLKRTQAKGTPRKDDMSPGAALLRIRDPKTGQPLPDIRLAAEFGGVLTGGFETSAHTITWTLALIAQHPDVDAKISAELDVAELLVTKERMNPKPLVFDHLARLPYLAMVIKEAMRMLPVISDGTVRVAQEDMILGGKYHIPAGTSIMVPFYPIFNSPQVWNEPETFNPERWRDPTAEFVSRTGTSKAGKAAADEDDDNDIRGGVRRYYPFSVGERDCLGRNLAIMTVTATLAYLLSRFSFRLADKMGGAKGVYDCEVIRLTLQPKEGMWLHCIPRVPKAEETTDLEWEMYQYMATRG